jgi:ferredoxin
MRGLARRTLLLAALAVTAIGASVGSANAAEEFDKYALESVSASLSSTQAGEHADFTTFFALTRANSQPYGKTRDIEVHLPPGMIGNPQGIPRCTIAQLGNAPPESECPVASQVGVSVLRASAPIPGQFTEPLYNMVPPGGDIVARFGFFTVLYPAFINVRVDPRDYSLVASVEGAPSGAGILEAATTLWGVPGASVHDEERLTPDEAVHSEFPKGGRKSGLPPAPFLSNPTDCSLVRQISVTARTYQLPPDQASTMSAPFPQITGCNKLSFDPSFTAIPTNSEAAAPTGLDATLKIPQDETPQGLATSTLKGAIVTLPEGMSINPAAGDGLVACSDEQVGYGENKSSSCPAGAKIGSAEIEVPALENTLQGAVYQRTPVPGRLFGFWLVTDEQGVHLKLPAEIQANPLTGQLTTVFNGIPTLGGNPQVPVEELRLHVFGGPRAPLATPSRCGAYQTHYAFTPWSGKPAVEGDTAMQITSGCGKDGFTPGLIAGMRSLRAGSFSLFTFTLSRADGEANLAKIAVHLPQGLLAKLAGVELCPDAQAASGACPTGSQVGSIATAAGVGGAPLWIPQPGKAPTAAYLAGPYKGAPYSIVSVVPAQAGPFDLGLVVNRAAINIDPETALATITTDPLPQILEGVPVAYRAIHVEVDHKNFTLNPTDCSQKEITATVTAIDGRVAEPSVAFQATNCTKLPYTPKLNLTFTGQTKRTGNPGVKAVLTQKANQANTAAATVILPKSQFIDNSHISNPCTRVQFAAEACPTGSILGTVEAKTPLLDRPLKGKVYFRSNGGDRELPDIVADLRGSIHITLVGFIDSVRGRVRTRFLSVPDAPVTKFKMNLFAGKRSLIENSEDLCKTGRRVKIRLVGQNGRSQASRPAMAAPCGKPNQK